MNDLLPWWSWPSAVVGFLFSFVISFVFALFCARGQRRIRALFSEKAQKNYCARYGHTWSDSGFCCVCPENKPKDLSIDANENVQLGAKRITLQLISRFNRPAYAISTMIPYTSQVGGMTLTCDGEFMGKCFVDRNPYQDKYSAVVFRFNSQWKLKWPLVFQLNLDGKSHNFVFFQEKQAIAESVYSGDMTYPI
jgi:hypothetical protein